MIGTQLTAIARRHPGATAVVFADRRLSYRDLETRACQVAGALAGLGLGRGDRVAGLLRNCNEFIELFFGAAKLGAVFVPLNFRLTAAELGPILDDCAPSALVGGEEFATVLAALDAEGRLPRRRVTVRNSGVKRHGGALELEYEAWLLTHSECTPDAGIDPDEPQLIVYSSGTTGRPKGAVWAHATTWCSSVAKIIDFRLQPADTVVVFGPLYHAGPLMDFAVPLLLRGGAVVLGQSGGFDPAVLLETLARERATIVSVYPTLWRRVLEAPEMNAFDRGALRILSTGGEPMSPQVLDAIYEQFPEVDFINTYGSTEGGPVTTFLDAASRFAKKGSVGKPAYSVDVRLVNEDGRVVGAGEVGELTVRSPFVCRGYWGREELTRDCLRDGWWHTGDFAYRDADGFLYICGRRQDLIISGAENIYPVEVEQALAACSLVMEAAVIGVPDERWGERVVAFAVPAPGAKPSAEDVRTHCRNMLAGYKLPREVFFVDALPRNSTNKVDRDALRRRYRESGSTAL